MSFREEDVHSRVELLSIVDTFARKLVMRSIHAIWSTSERDRFLLNF